MSKRPIDTPTTNHDESSCQQQTSVRIKFTPKVKNVPPPKQPPSAPSPTKPKKPRRGKTHKHERRAHRPDFMDALNELTIRYQFLVIPESYFDYEDSWFLKTFIKNRFTNDKSIAGIIEVPPSNLGNGYKYNTDERLLFINIRPSDLNKDNNIEYPMISITDCQAASLIEQAQLATRSNLESQQNSLTIKALKKEAMEETKEARILRLREILATVVKVLDKHHIKTSIREPDAEKGYKEPVIIMENATVPICDHCQEEDE